jgi:hypothetical protein
MHLCGWWERFVTLPARLLMQRLSSELPRKNFNGIELIVADPTLADRMEAFFDQTSKALASAASCAPTAYADLRNDVQRIILWDGQRTSLYHRFQLAVLVPPKLAFESDTVSYAIWLLYMSGLSQGIRSAQDRSEEFLDSLEPPERTRVSRWLSAVIESQGE